MTLADQLRNYTPFNEQEATDKPELLRALEEEPNVFSRENRSCHFTGSGWVVSPDRKKVLMVYHNIYDSWSWMGGHADGEKNLCALARREIMEESGICDLKLLSPDIFSLEVLTVDGHEKKGKYVSSHLHLNVTYLFEGDPSLPLKHKPDENSGVRWIDVEKLPEAVSEIWFMERIYSKLVKKTTKMGF